MSKSNSYKITVVGAGYAGLSSAVMLAQNNDVVVLETQKSKVDLINKKISPIKDVYIEKYFAERNLKITATQDSVVAYKNSNFIIVAVPTDFCKSTNNFDTKIVEFVVSEILKVNSKAAIVIKSTVPIGFTNYISKKFNSNNIYFSPEFLRETQALKDNLYPDRIIVSKNKSNDSAATEYANLVKSCCQKKDAPVIYMSSSEAEAVKLFSNTFLAMRISFFNELDSFAIKNNLNVQKVIEGVCADKRIGNYYNNPSFGYGGYCLPKDTKQLLTSFESVPENIIRSTVKSNDTRKKFIIDEVERKATQIAKKNSVLPNDITIGIFRLAMKSNSDNFRNSSVMDIAKGLLKRNFKVIVYEPFAAKSECLDENIVEDINRFKNESDVIIANRYSAILNDVKEKVFCRDIFFRD